MEIGCLNATLHNFFDLLKNKLDCKKNGIGATIPVWDKYLDI